MVQKHILHTYQEASLTNPFWFKECNTLSYIGSSMKALLVQDFQLPVTGTL